MVINGQISGGLEQISVGSHDNIWGINSIGNIWKRVVNTNEWIHIPGRLKYVSVNHDGDV